MVTPFVQFGQKQLVTHYPGWCVVWLAPWYSCYTQCQLLRGVTRTACLFVDTAAPCVPSPCGLLWLCCLGRTLWHKQCTSFASVCHRVPLVQSLCGWTTFTPPCKRCRTLGSPVSVEYHCHAVKPKSCVTCRHTCLACLSLQGTGNLWCSSVQYHCLFYTLPGGCNKAAAGP